VPILVPSTGCLVWNVSGPPQFGFLAMEGTEMLPISHCEWPIAKTSKKAGFILSLLVLALFPHDLAAQGLPVETGSHLPVALWFIGAAQRRTITPKKTATALATDDDGIVRQRGIGYMPG